MTLKVNMIADTDEFGRVPEITGRNIASVDASACGDERQAIDEAFAFMKSMEMGRLKVRYGTGSVELRYGDKPEQKAEELFYASCCFSLYDVKSLKDPELAFGNPNRSCDITTAAHSALRISKHFDRKVSFQFNGVAIPPIEQKGDITTQDIRAVVQAYSAADAARNRRNH